MRAGLEDLNDLRDVLVRLADVALHDAHRVVEDVAPKSLDALPKRGAEQQGCTTENRRMTSFVIR